MTRLPIALICLIGCVASGCGSGPSSPSGTPDATVTIGPSGVSPKEVRIKAGGRVQFVNSDVRPHQISSDPVQIHTDCPGVNQVGLLAAGARADTAALSAVRTCGYHDHNDEFNPIFQGRIVVE